MSRLLVLPTPLPSTSFTVGQLVANPIQVETSSFKSSSEPLCCPTSTQLKFQSIATQDEHGRFLPTTSERDFSLKETTIRINADTSSHTSLPTPRAAFSALRLDATAQSYLRQAAASRQDLYYVTGLQILKNPSFQLGGDNEGNLASAPAGQFRLPMHVRRVDSAFGLDNTNNANNDNSEVLFAVEFLKVRCRVGPSTEPHRLDDIEYNWSYHQLDNGDLQLSIGLGKHLEADELMTLAGMETEDEMIEGSWESSSVDVDEGMGGF